MSERFARPAFSEQGIAEIVLGLRKPGINPDGVVTVELSASGAQYDTDEKIWRFYRGVLDRIQSLPGVVEAGASISLPFTGAFGCTVQGFDDSRVYDRLEQSDLTSCAGQVPTTPGYFAAMGIPVLRGRAFTASDNDNPTTSSSIVSWAWLAMCSPARSLRSPRSSSIIR